MLRDDEYMRLQATFLAIARHSDRPQEQARWLALVRACHEELVATAEMRLKPDPHWQTAEFPTGSSDKYHLRHHDRAMELVPLRFCPGIAQHHDGIARRRH